MRIRLSLVLPIALACLAFNSEAQTYTNAFPGVTFARPINLLELPGKPGYFYILEQSAGVISYVRMENTAWVKSQFAKITVAGGNEQGLLGMALHPQFNTNKKYYVYFVGPDGGTADIVEERVANAELTADAGTAPRKLISLPDPEGNHNGGTLGFGKDGFLYISVGDGGGQDDMHGATGNGQNKNVLFGKLLRIDVDKPANGKNYGIPTDNPFAAGGGAGEVYAYGLRNPYKWSFDPVTQDLWVGDVGQNAAEEVSIIKKGGNYGWKQVEGDRCFVGGCTLANFAPPVYAYSRANGGNCVIGGVVFRGDPASPYYGQFIHGDNGGGNVWAVRANGQRTNLARPNVSGISSFNSDSKGKVYIMGVGSGTIYRLDGAGWDAAATMIPRHGLLRSQMGRTFTSAPGARLDMAAFSRSDRLYIVSLDGTRSAAISGQAPLLPANLAAGVYLLSPAAGTAGETKPDLLLVR